MEKNYLPAENRELINEFLASQELAGKAENTLKKYRSLLEKFFTQCPKPLKELTSDDVHAWLISQYGDKKKTTWAHSISVLASFFKYCRHENYLNRVPIKSSWRPRLPKPLPKYLTFVRVFRDRLCGFYHVR